LVGGCPLPTKARFSCRFLAGLSAHADAAARLEQRGKNLAAVGAADHHDTVAFAHDGVGWRGWHLA
jgi:hypothetical protein